MVQVIAVNRLGPLELEQHMTGYTVHTGSSVKFSEAWNRIFQEGAKAADSKTASTRPTTSAAKKKTVKARGNAKRKVARK